MRICWDTLEGVRLTKNGIFLKNGRASYVYKDSCKVCGDPFLYNKHSPSDFCSRSCAGTGEGHWNYGKHLTDEHKAKLSKAFKGEKNPFFGKTHSDDTKALLSMKNKGKKLTLEARRKMSKSRKGKPVVLSKEGRESRSRLLSGSNNPMYGRKGKLSPAYGRTVSEDTRKKLSEAHKGRNMGENNPNWKGGKSFEPYCPLWKDREYKSTIKERDNNICQNPYCYKTDKMLHIHHIDYDKKNCHPNNLITVCRACNSRANVDREWHIEWYQTIMNKKYHMS